MDDVLKVLVPLSVGLLLLTMFVITVRASIRDARRRGKSPALVSLAVILFFPWGLIAWLLFRPEPLDGAKGNGAFHLDDHRVQ
jgi:Kef-type K+ transport system membrane component KefB